MVICLDTSIIVDYVRRGKGPFLDLLAQVAKEKGTIVVSTIVIYEFWSGKSMKAAKSIKQAEELFSIFKTIEISADLAQKAGSLVRENLCHGNDALIAATALEINAELATLNTKHFTHVPGLKLWQPKSAP